MFSRFYFWCLPYKPTPSFFPYCIYITILIKNYFLLLYFNFFNKKKNYELKCVLRILQINIILYKVLTAINTKVRLSSDFGINWIVYYVAFFFCYCWLDVYFSFHWIFHFYSANELPRLIQSNQSYASFYEHVKLFWLFIKLRVISCRKDSSWKPLSAIINVNCY